jgi:5'-phosphate synthase pdxT subunit
MLVGVLALQGAFREHQQCLEKCGVAACQVRKKTELENIDALIIPGGESTTIGKLMRKFELMKPIQDLANHGLPILGTCAGLIMLAKEINNSEQETLGLMDIKAERNAYGRQVDSFETDLDIPVLGTETFRGIFIRAPYIAEAAGNVHVLAYNNDKIVFARQDRFLAAAFHPELTNDLRFHRYFIENVVR